MALTDEVGPFERRGGPCDKVEESHLNDMLVGKSPFEDLKDNTEDGLLYTYNKTTGEYLIEPVSKKKDISEDYKQ